MIRVSQKDRPVSSSPLYMNVARYSTRCILYHFFCPVPYINLKLPFHARPIRQTRRCSRESHDTWSMHANATVGWRRSKRHGRASASSPIWSGSRKLSVPRRCTSSTHALAIVSGRKRLQPFGGHLYAKPKVCHASIQLRKVESCSGMRRSRISDLVHTAASAFDCAEFSDRVHVLTLPINRMVSKPRALPMAIINPSQRSLIVSTRYISCLPLTLAIHTLILRPAKLLAVDATLRGIVDCTAPRVICPIGHSRPLGVTKFVKMAQGK